MMLNIDGEGLQCHRRSETALQTDMSLRPVQVVPFSARLWLYLFLFFHIFPCLWSDLLTSFATSIPPLGKASTQYGTKSVFWRWEKHLSVCTGNNTFPQLLHLLSEQLQDNTLSACIIFFESIQERCLVNKMFSVYWLDVLIGRQGSLVRFCIILFLVADLPPHNTFRCVSVRIRMQSYYTLEGLSQSHRMAMNFKCGIKAFREAGTRGRLTQFLANLIFFFFS